MALIELNEVLQVLMDFARDLEENYTQHLVQSGHYTTNYGLIDSVHTDIEVNGMGYNVTMTLNDYWKWVENDTRPHFPPPDKILEWIKVKPIIPRPTALGHKPTEKQLAYLIGRKIYNEGTEGTHDLEKTKDALIPFYEQKLKEALRNDMKNYIVSMVKGGIE